MMNDMVKQLARQKVGQYLKGIREGKGLSTYQITKEHGIRFEVIKAIEEGSSNYTIDNFLGYIGAIDCYFYLENKEGKHLDADDMINKMR
jgi:transcriptional regulator with XRE-family HTH domain